MIHNANTIAYGNATRHRRAARKIDGILVATYTEATRPGSPQIADWMAAETGLQPKKPCSKFADRIAQTTDSAAQATPSRWNLAPGPMPRQ